MKIHAYVLALLVPLLASQVIFSSAQRPAVVNVHESVESLAEIVVLQNAMENTGIVFTVLHAIPNNLLNFSGEISSLSEVSANNAALQKVLETYPDQFAYFCSIDPNNPQRIEELQKCLEQGAVGVKLYNGYSYSHVTPLDDAKLQDFYDAIENAGTLLMLPVNTAEYEDEFRNVLTLHPDMTVICPHFCLSSKNLERLTSLMNDFPNLYIDTSFGNLEFVKEGFTTISANIYVFELFFKKFQDRILFGTDVVLTSNTTKDSLWTTKLFNDYIALFSEDSMTPQLVSDSMLNGLNLPYAIQRKIFYLNWMQLTN